MTHKKIVCQNAKLWGLAVTKIIIKDRDLQCIYPIVDIVLRMFLCTASSNVSGERSFLVLKRVKHYLRSTLTEDHLNHFALLNIEHELTSKLQ